jgi:hypothetical protein
MFPAEFSGGYAAGNHAFQVIFLPAVGGPKNYVIPAGIYRLVEILNILRVLKQLHSKHFLSAVCPAVPDVYSAFIRYSLIITVILVFSRFRKYNKGHHLCACSTTEVLWISQSL